MPRVSPLPRAGTVAIIGEGGYGRGIAARFGGCAAALRRQAAARGGAGRTQAGLSVAQRRRLNAIVTIKTWAVALASPM